MDTSVSIIIPTYNRAESLGDVIESIIWQTHAASEIIVVDDGSIDQTPQLIIALRRKFPEWSYKLRYLFQDNQGKSAALNLGLRHAASEWIAFTDSDDVWLKDKLEVQFAALGQFPTCSACITDCVYSDGSNERKTSLSVAGTHLHGDTGILANAVSLAIKIGHGIMMQTLLARRRLIEEVGNFDPILRVSQDCDILFKLALATDICYVNSPLVILDRSAGRDRLTVDFPSQNVQRLQLQRQMLINWSKLVHITRPKVSAQVEKRLRTMEHAIANCYIDLRDWKNARQTLGKSLRRKAYWKTAVKWLFTVIHVRVQSSTPKEKIRS